MGTQFNGDIGGGDTQTAIVGTKRSNEVAPLPRDDGGDAKVVHLSEIDKWIREKGKMNYFTEFIVRWPRYICLFCIIFELIFAFAVLNRKIIDMHDLPVDIQRDFYDIDHVGTKMPDAQ
jgi:hypothetical protein